MSNAFLSAPETAAQAARDRLLGALVGLARATVNEPKTADTDRVLACGWPETPTPTRTPSTG